MLHDMTNVNINSVWYEDTIHGCTPSRAMSWEQGFSDTDASQEA